MGALCIRSQPRKGGFLFAVAVLKELKVSPSSTFLIFMRIFSIATVAHEFVATYKISDSESVG
jgi:hypothetical protein